MDSPDCDDVKAYLINALFTQAKSEETAPKLKTVKRTTRPDCKTAREDLEEKNEESISPVVSSAATRTTSDGFKIVSESDLLQDDSDISDAFESNDEDDDGESDSDGNNADETIRSRSSDRYTNDGFKIVPSIPDDDSDVSDAFCEEASDEEQDDGSSDEFKSSKQESPFGKKISAVKENTSITATDHKLADELSNDMSISQKKRKRGQKKKNKTDPGTLNVLLSTSAKSKKKKREIQTLSTEDIEIIKSRYPPHVHKIVEKLGLNWADLESKKMREKRELSKLPQPAQIPNCQVYLKKCQGTNKVLTVYDYSAKRKGVPGLSEEKSSNKKLKSDKKSGTSGKEKDESITPEEEAKLKERREMKKQHLEELRSIKRRLNAQVVNKVLDPATRTQNMLAKIEKLGGSKVKKPMVNYKVYMEQKKSEKLADEEKRQNLRDVGMRDLVKKKRRSRKRRDANDVPGWGSLGGRFSREGVRVVRRKEKANLDSA